jgi:C4-type Zn-finger protein
MKILKITDKPQKEKLPPFNCPYCGRFAHFIIQYRKSTPICEDVIIVWNCSQCGTNEEGTQ